jgi:putative peptidoglycan lipid II flippase
MKKATLLVMIMTIVSKFLGFGREMVFSYLYGVSVTTDAYLVSQTIPLAVFSFIASGVATGFVPMYSRILKEHSKPEADEFTSNLASALLLFASAVVVVVLIFARPIVKVFASGFTGQTLILAVRLTRISVFGVYFTGLVHIFTGYLRLYGNFIIPASIALPLNLVIIGSLFVSSRTSVDVLALGTVLAPASQLLLYLPFIRRTGYTYKPLLNLNDDYIKEMALVALPVVVGTAVHEVNVLIDKTLASTIAVGGISALNYANRINGFVQGLFVVSVTTVLYPTISRMAANGDVDGFKARITEAISMVSLLVVPSTVGAMVFSQEIVTLLFGRGAFNQDAVLMTGRAFFYYSLGTAACGLRDVSSSAFYALQDTKTPMLNTTIGVALNIVLNVFLARLMGVGGLALATSVSGMISALLICRALKKKIGAFGMRESAKSLVKIVVASILMGVTARLCFRLLGRLVSANRALIMAVGIGVVVYSVLIYLARIPAVDRTVAVAKRQLRRFGRRSSISHERSE